MQNDVRFFLTPFLFVFTLIIAGKPDVAAQWSPNNPISVGGGLHPGIVSDGAGGAIIASYTGPIASRVNGSGIIQWTTAIGSGLGQQVPVSITSDGAEGAFFAWIGSGFNLYAQHVNASGVLQWTSGAVLICTGTNTSYDPSIVSDGAGGVIVIWFDYRNTNSIYAQHVSAAGNVQWITNGVAICSGTSPVSNNSYGPEAISDGAGGAIVSWTDTRNGNSDIYAQRINAAGNVQWQANGIPICALPSNQGGGKLTTDGQGGAIVTWIDSRNGNDDIYAQRISPLGFTQWSQNGIPICNWGGIDFSPMIVNDDIGGAVIGWMRNGGIYSQKVNSTGELQWATGPVAITTVSGAVDLTMANDGDGGAVIAWWLYNINSYDIFAQRINSAGAVVWSTNGIGVCTTPDNQGYPVIANNGMNGAVVSWNNSSGGTYAQNVNADGTIGPPATPVINCPAGNVSITSNLTGATYQWQVNNGSGFVNISDNSNYSGTNSASLQLNNIPTGWYGYIYRCIVNGLYSTNSKLKFLDNWTGNVNGNWENASNWSCGTIPDASTDVVINTGNVFVNINTTVRTLTLAPNVNLTVAPGVTLTIIHP